MPLRLSKLLLRTGLALLALQGALTSPMSAAAAPPPHGSTYINPRYAFEVAVPPQLMQRELPDSPAALVLQSVGVDYPTFNVIVGANAGRAETLSLSEQAQRVVEDYRKVGLVDAKILSEVQELIGGRNAATFVLTYSSSGQYFTSQVTVLTTRRFRYLLTYIDRSDSFAAQRGLRQALFSSFRSSDAAPEQADQPAGPLLFYFLAGGVLLCLTFFSALAFRSRRRTIPN